MTRRICAFKQNEKFYISQEFNGDKSEQSLFNPRPSISVDWDYIIGTFDGSQTLEDFKAAVHSMENAYEYEHFPVEAVDTLPDAQEVWMLIDGELRLYSQYGNLVKPCFFCEKTENANCSMYVPEFVNGKCVPKQAPVCKECKDQYEISFPKH